MGAAPPGWLSQLRRGVIEGCVLAVLRDGECYGYDLVKSLANAGELVTSEGTVYPLLSRLHRKGLIESSERPSEKGPPRRYYRLTADGKAALETFLRDWARFRGSVDGLLWPGATP